MDPDERMRRIEWCREQLKIAEVPKEVHGTVWNLLNVWWQYNLSPESTEVALDTFVSLAQNHALTPSTPGEAWVDARPGSIYMRDEVRVKPDAYPGDAGRVHNMRRGRVVGIRHGDIIVRYDDGREPAFDGVHHTPHALEKRIQ